MVTYLSRLECLVELLLYTLSVGGGRRRGGSRHGMWWSESLAGMCIFGLLNGEIEHHALSCCAIDTGRGHLHVCNCGGCVFGVSFEGYQASSDVVIDQLGHAYAVITA